jgi:hypothetical protein
MGTSSIGIYALGALALSEIMRGRLDDAARTVDRAMTALEAHGGTAEEGEGIARLACAELLIARGDETGARQALARAKERLETRANMITNSEWRRSFLEVVPEHKRTMDLAMHYRI